MPIKLEGFGGMIPRVGARLLPPMAATLARNVNLLQGELRGFRDPLEIEDLSFEYMTVRRAMKIVDPSGSLYGDTWITFDSRNVDIVRSPLINDTHDRYYWAGDGRPKYNSGYRIVQGLPEWYLGIPVPATAMIVTPPAGTTVTRAYVCTFVSGVGEEGPPSPPTLATGTTGTWALSSIPTAVADSANRNVTHKKIYRTVSGNSSSTFFYVDIIPIAQTTYSDVATDAEVAANNVLESTSFFEPPTDLEGFVVMPGGYLAGWAGRRLVFSEPYRPHAWPPEYEQATDYPIVGLAVWGNTLVVGTQSRPYLGQGVHPSAFTTQRMDAVEPCLSRRGMVATVAGVYYPSLNGLAFVNASGVSIITQGIMTKQEWAEYNPQDFFAAQLGLQYIAFNQNDVGIIFNPTEPTSRLVEIDAVTNIQGIETDPYTGDVLLIKQNKVWQWDPAGSSTIYWRWKSKEYQFPKPVNFSALKISFDDGGSTGLNITAFQDYNAARLLAGSLGTVNGHSLCGPAENAGLVPLWTEAENIQPLGGGALYTLEDLATRAASVRIIAYAGERGVVFDAVIDRQRMLRMPAGFKSDLWQFELIGNTPVYSVQIGESAKALARA